MAKKNNKKIAKKATKKKVAKKAAPAKKKKTAKKKTAKKKTLYAGKSKQPQTIAKKKAKRKTPKIAKPVIPNPIEGQFVIVSDTSYLGTRKPESETQVPEKAFLPFPVSTNMVRFLSKEDALAHLEEITMFGTIEHPSDVQIVPASEYLEPSYAFTATGLVSTAAVKGEGVPYKTAYKTALTEATNALREFKKANLQETKEEKRQIQAAIRNAQVRQKDAAIEIALSEKRISEFKAKWGVTPGEGDGK